jgi:hypothetical protein
MTQPPSGREPSPWDLDPPDDLADMTLGDVLRQAAQLPSRVEDDDAVQIAVRVAPIGFRGIIRQLAREARPSYSHFIRKALDHGMAILDKTESIIALREAYDLTNSSAMSSGDLDALGRLNQTAGYDFKHPQSLRTSFTASKNTTARVADLAIVCGIPLPRLAVLTVLVSVLTLPNNRGYRAALVDEIEAFERFVVYRTRVLRLGDGPDSGGAGTPRRLR